MNQEEKEDKLKQLKKIDYPSDQELEEIEKLEEEINIIQQESRPPVKEIDVNPKKQRKTIFQYVYERMKTKPATYNEIQQLKLERHKAILIRDIKIAKSQTPSRLGKSLKLLSSLSDNTNGKK